MKTICKQTTRFACVVNFVLNADNAVESPLFRDDFFLDQYLRCDSFFYNSATSLWSFAGSLLACIPDKKGLSLGRNVCWKQNDPEIQFSHIGHEFKLRSSKHMVVAARSLLKLSNYSENIRLKATHAAVPSFSSSTWLDRIDCSILRYICAIHC